MSVDKILQPLLIRYATSFGGSYIDIRKKRLIVNTIDHGKVNEIKSRMRENSKFLSFENAIYGKSMHNLKVSFDGIVKLAIDYLKNNDSELNANIYIDIKENNVVVILGEYDNINNQTFISSLMRYNPLIKIFSKHQSDPNISKRQSKIGRRDISKRIFSGDGLYNGVGEFECSAGFWVKNRDLIDYIVTAGHCVMNSNTRKSNDFYHYPWDAASNKTLNYIGESVFSNLEPYDFALIQVFGNDSKLSMNEVKNIDYIRFPQLFITKTLPVSSYGIHICKAGFTTHLTCGYVKGNNGIAILNGKILRTLIITDVRLEGGDSGGSAFSFAQDLRSVELLGIAIGSSPLATAVLPVDIILRSLEIPYRFSSLGFEPSFQRKQRSSLLKLDGKRFMRWGYRGDA
ncbi:8973_t:CDS:2 [Cetraspora pellucida]|uniref:8973_t:CDS:1 n=1 Tax=Cetraspora pellucida TaxID=1433469 RepID=A0A9N9CA47_9GLOM|nr:8973_t:CDS:2 [Cetraspora pellucida]